MAVEHITTLNNGVGSVLSGIPADSRPFSLITCAEWVGRFPDLSVVPSTFPLISEITVVASQPSHTRSALTNTKTFGSGV